MRQRFVWNHPRVQRPIADIRSQGDEINRAIGRGFRPCSRATGRGLQSRTLIILLLAMLLSACCSGNPKVPKIGDQFSCEGYTTVCALKEQTTTHIKWAVRANDCSPFYYVTCDSSNRVVAIWGF